MTKAAAELLGPREAAIEAQVFAQQIYQAVASGLLAAERRDGRILIRRGSFERWKANLELRRRMRAEERRIQECAGA